MKSNPFRDKVTGFESLLDTINPENISSNAYCQRYFQHLQMHKEYYLNIYADLLQKVMEKGDRPKEEMSLIDYGAGNGLLGIFAAYCGFKKVFINDIDTSFLESSSRLATLLKIQIHGFIEGDIENVRKYFSDERPNVLVATDVIEHIYDPLHFLKVLQDVNPKITTGFTTASNPHNFLKVQRIKKLQQTDELKGSDPSMASLTGSPHPAFFEMRKEIISSNFDLTEYETIKLAMLTRGLRKEDILSSVKIYLQQNKLPVPADSTNTCNPLTGSWTERIVPLQQYRSMFKQAGFTLSVHNGFYDEYSNGIKSIFNKIMNKNIFILGKFLSPYIILIGYNTSSERL